MAELKPRLLTLLALVWLTGCQVSTQITPRAIPSPTSSLLPSTITPVNASPTSISTNTSSPTVEARPTESLQHCEVETSDQAQFLPKGVLVFDQNEGSPAMLVNVATSEKTPLPIRTSTTMKVTPDGSALAYVDVDSSERRLLHVVNSQGNSLVSYSLNPEWDSIDKGWLNDHQIIIRVSRSQDVSVEEVVVLDPFVGNTKSLNSNLPDYPNLYALGPFVPEGVNLRPNSSIEYVVYPHLDSKSYTVFDLTAQQSLLSIETYNSFGHPAVWSNEGDKFIVVQAVAPSSQTYGQFGPPEELIEVSTANKQRRLTDFARQFDDYFFRQYAWSPDDRYIAMWVALNLPTSSDPLETVYLFVLDTSSSEIKSYCLLDDQSDGRGDIIWSPDSNYFIVRRTTEAKTQGAVIVNRVTGEIRDLSETQMPVGWMKP